MTTGHPSVWPMTSGVAALLASMSLQEWAAVAGIIGVFAGLVFGWRRDRRERLAFEYETGKRADRRNRPIRASERINQEHQP